MKRFLISMMALGALVLLANKSFAQGKLTPVVGVAYDYSVSITASGDGTYTFYANQSTTTADNTGSPATFNSGSTATYTAGAVAPTANVTWGAATASNTYNLWIELVGTGSYCTNRRYVEVTPQANTFSATIFAYGQGTTTPTTADQCPDLTGNNFLDGSATDGTTTLYYKVTLNAHNDSGTWDPGISFTSGTGTKTYSYDGGSSWIGTASTSVSVLTTEVWVKIETDNSTSPTDFTASIDPVETLSGGQTITTEGSPSDASLLLKGLPFTGSSAVFN